MKGKITRWKILSSTTVFSHSSLKLIEDVVMLPSGQTARYLKAESVKCHAVAVVAINKKGEILLQQQYNHPSGAILWELPGGSMKIGETISAAANRELAEETGYSAKKTKIVGWFYTDNRLSDKKQYVVICEELYKRSLPPDEDEFILPRWFTEDQIKRMISRGEFHNMNLLAGLTMWFQSAQH